VGNARGLLLAAFAVGGILFTVSVLDDSEPVASNAPAPPPTSASPVPTTTEPAPGPAARSEIGVAEIPGTTPTDAPHVDFTNAEAVVSAYLTTAHTLYPEDAGRTNRRVLPYLTQDNPDNPRGITVVEAPSGKTAVAKVLTVERVTGNDTGSARAYRATWSVDGQVAEGYVVVVRQPDNRWLVRQETARLQPADR
jgi:hypothetical protein